MVELSFVILDLDLFDDRYVCIPNQNVCIDFPTSKAQQHRYTQTPPPPKKKQSNNQDLIGLKQGERSEQEEVTYSLETDCEKST